MHLGYAATVTQNRMPQAHLQPSPLVEAPWRFSRTSLEPPPGGVTELSMPEILRITQTPNKSKIQQITQMSIM